MGVLVGDTRPLSEGRTMQIIREDRQLREPWDMLPDSTKRELLPMLRETRDERKMKRMLRRAANRSRYHVRPEVMKFFRWREDVLRREDRDSFIDEIREKVAALSITEKDETVWQRVKRLFEAKEKF